MAEDSKPRLGRGLAALLGDGAEEAISPVGGHSEGLRTVPIERLKANPANPRKRFSEEELEELAQSIRDKGVLQPILVRPSKSHAGSFEIVAGERRWRAAQKAGIHTVPVIKIEATDKQALEIAIVENVQRADLNPLEEAEGYKRLIGEFEYSHGDLGKAIGKSRSYVTNALRLLKLPEETRVMLSNGQISAGHARALLSLPDPDAIARDILKKGLSVRDVEHMTENPSFGSKESKSVTRNRPDPHVAQMEKAMSDSLGMRVALAIRGEVGDVRIRFETLEQLELISQKLRT